MKMNTLADQVFDSVKGFVLRSFEPLAERIKALEDRPPAKDGEQGQQGEKGADGTNGKDGAPGPQGEPGIDGKDGAPGQDGRDGINGKDGAPGERGADGERGQPGEKGMDGRDGMEGPAGRDALQIEVMDGIDPQKRYQRGTFAAHRGGIVRSFKGTEPLGDSLELEKHGWHVVVRGVADLEISMADDLRTVTVTHSMTDGAAVVKSMQVPAVIDRGVYRETEAYAKGDGVTWGGSYFIAQKAAPDGKPGESDSWRLAVKRGRDGKDAPQPAAPAKLVRLA
jgi:hypothetical protein